LLYKEKPLKVFRNPSRLGYRFDHELLQRHFAAMVEADEGDDEWAYAEQPPITWKE
jgi:hypothetical protein